MGVRNLPSFREKKNAQLTMRQSMRSRGNISKTGLQLTSFPVWCGICILCCIADYE